MRARAIRTRAIRARAIGACNSTRRCRGCGRATWCAFHVAIARAILNRAIGTRRPGPGGGVGAVVVGGRGNSLGGAAELGMPPESPPCPPARPPAPALTMLLTVLAGCNAQGA